MSVLLTIALIQLLISPSLDLVAFVPFFLRQIILGVAVGGAIGKGMVLILNRLKLEYEGLYPVLSIALVLLTYSLTDLLGGSGFLAVYLAGLVVGNSEVLHKRALMRFHEGIAWLMQITMFLALGLLATPSKLIQVIPAGLALSAFLIFVARPVSVFLSLALSRDMDHRDKLMVSWVGLRGAVPIILATFPLIASTTRAEYSFQLVFFIVITSVLVQGTTIPFVARLLRVDAPYAQKRRYPLEFESVEGMDADLVELMVPYTAACVGKRIIELGLPPESLITLICRNEKYIIPSGAVRLEAGDVLLVLADEAHLPEVQRVISRAQKPEMKS